MSDGDWHRMIVEYLENPVGTTDLKVKHRELSYTIMGNKLFHKTSKGILLKFLSENEVYLEIFYVHDGSCGAHQEGHKIKWILFRQGVYGPTMLKICIKFSKGCQECQKHAGIQHIPISELYSVVKP